MKKQSNYKISIIALIILIPLLIILSSCAATVTFDADGGTLVSGELEQKFKEGTEVIPPTLEKDGYALVGWDGNYESPEEDVTVKAIWKPLIKVTFDANGGHITDESLLEQFIPQGYDATSPEISRDGYEFDGWDSDITNITSEMTVKAQWTRLWNVTYDAKGGTFNDEALKEQTVRDGEEATTPTVTRDKYIFKEWEKKVNQSKSTITYNAVWERKTYTGTELYAMANPATVEVITFRRNNIKMGLGSGFFIDENGTFVTNYHVIEDSREIKIKLFDSKEYNVVSVVGYNKAKDIAILKADTKGQKVAYLEYAEEPAKVGEAVYALGSSLGLTGSFSSGIVSYVDREVDGVKFVQSTAPISAGNSGGPLIDEHGWVVGVNTASYTEGQNLNLSVSVNELTSLSKTTITLSQFFENVSIFPFYVGEICKDIKESGTSIDLLENGQTANASTYTKDFDSYLTKVDSDAKYILCMVATDEALNCLYTPPVPVGGKSPDLNNMSVYDDFDIFYLDGYEGNYICVTIAEIYDSAYEAGYVYYGAAITCVSDSYEEYDYQCMICAIDEKTYTKIMES